MPKIEWKIENYVTGSKAHAITPLPSNSAPGLKQRGPSCGFYALGFVMQYWFERQQMSGGNLTVGAPVRVREHDMPPTVQREAWTRELDQFLAELGEFKSLRQYGKFHGLTRYGSMFNAESLVKVARGQGAQWAGQYDGQVVRTPDAATLIATAKKLIDHKCPVIIPYDVNDKGDPWMGSGSRAHWATLVGYFPLMGKGADWFIFFHSGEYFACPAADMANSCQQLTANAFLIMRKYEIHDKNGKLTRRENITESRAEEYRKRGCTVTEIGQKKPLTNFEFCDPQGMSTLQAQLGVSQLSVDEMKKHGFDPHNLQNAGLRQNIVVVYPASVATKIAALL
jgi:hypothetical protein